MGRKVIINFCTLCLRNAEDPIFLCIAHLLESVGDYFLQPFDIHWAWPKEEKDQHDGYVNWNHTLLAVLPSICKKGTIGFQTS